MHQPHDPYAALRFPDFRRLVLSHWSLTIATQIQAVVVGWQIFELTRDPLSLGLIGLAEALPFIAVALYAGHVADRTTRRTIAIIGQFVLLACAVALLALTLWPPQRQVWLMYAVIFVSGIARSFIRPAATALSAELIPRELYPNAVAWRTSSWQFAAVVGPAVGGLLYGFRGPAVAYGVDVALMLVSLAAIATVRHKVRPVAPEEMPIGESLRLGLRFVMREPTILAALTLDLFAVLFGGAVALLPIFADILKVGPQGLGILRAAPAVGSIISGLVLAHRPPLRTAGITLLASVALFGVAMIAFALSTSFYLSLVLLTLSGMADNVSVVIRATLMQTLTPPHMLGRVSSVNQIFIGSSNEIGAFESGVAARIMGTVPSVVFGGVMTLVVVALTAWWAPSLRRLKEIHAST